LISKARIGAAKRWASSQNELADMVFEDVRSAWSKYGRQTVNAMFAGDAEAIATMNTVAKFLPRDVNRLEIGNPGDFSRAKTKAELIDMIRVRGGEEGVQIFKQLLMTMGAIDQGDEIEVGGDENETGP